MQAFPVRKGAERTRTAAAFLTPDPEVSCRWLLTERLADSPSAQGVRRAGRAGSLPTVESEDRNLPRSVSNCVALGFADVSTLSETASQEGTGAT